MSGLATAQSRLQARDVQPGWYLYSWRQMQWTPVTHVADANGQRTFTVAGQDQPITAAAGDWIDVCTP